jgi:hypothetical protein
MKDKKKTKASGAAETKPAIVATVDDTAKPDEVVAEAPATAPKTEEKVKGEKGKGKNKDKKGKKDKKK